MTCHFSGGEIFLGLLDLISCTETLADKMQIDFMKNSYRFATKVNVLIILLEYIAN